MSRKIRKLLTIIFALIFVICCAIVVVNKWPYWKNSMDNKKAADTYTEKNESKTGPSSEKLVIAPIKVDFEALKAVNSDIYGWIYCEGTNINYPLLQGKNNDSYIHTNYKGESNFAGAIFVDSANLKDFQDNNTIIYGHNMADGSMFAELSNWQMQDFFDAHKVIWILTPDGDYMAELFSAYITDANSYVYTIYRGEGPEYSSYIKRVSGESYVRSGVEIESDSKCVLLSTCTYAEGDARSVIHGVLKPVDSVGGVKK
ncbi:MAG: class B sortase [Firmicutes bacterium]|nr:class B sortase [Bacillota bacterium]